jgi:hypothetical protein
MPVDTYDAIEAAMTAIVERCRADEDRAGYFAAMYLAVTRTVRARAQQGHFADTSRMEHFVSRFARRYLDAEAACRAGQPTTKSWAFAFDTSRRRSPVILQHLLLGMNAHINLDLGVVAAGVAEGGALDAVQADFDAVNDVLGELIGGCEKAVGDVSPWIALCDRIGGRTEQALIKFSLVVARRQAWASAVRLAPLQGEALVRATAELDEATAGVGWVVMHPGRWARILLAIVRLRERAKPSAVIDRLRAVQPSA